MSEKPILKFKRIDPEMGDIPLPAYQSEGAAGMDIRAAVAQQFIIPKGGFAAIPTNLQVEIPHGFEIQVRARSGLAFKNGIGVLNAPGTIDEDYRGEIKVILFNFGEEDFTINRGDRIAQLILGEVHRACIIETDTLSDTSRGSGGFGSTGAV
ncbi:MAG: dUTP diphosphatase [Ignavibacteriales bacterium]|nr:Deoxyuridine 5'-triphosphate nucleotidohydrolase [Ignavibacteriaceae bacterium]MBZ0196193.1 dUTP diphosphatase [Ignavibacteriaceae bacterium]MCZ2143293.1 dUTP diphosphatase [Ignavibacteriales bacterium]WKZ72379.1 MAG: dUTP diphosphatase [Ignavibacteriaceae bacterium]